MTGIDPIYLVGATGFEPATPCAQERGFATSHDVMRSTIEPKCLSLNNLTQVIACDRASRNSSEFTRARRERADDPLFSEHESARFSTRASIGQNLNRVSARRQLALLVTLARANRKQAHSHPSRLDRDDAAGLQGVDELGQVRDQRSGECIRPPAALAAKLDNRRLSRRTLCEERSEISIRRHHDSMLKRSAIKDHIVVGVLQSYRANVDRVMTGLL